MAVMRSSVESFHEQGRFQKESQNNLRPDQAKDFHLVDVPRMRFLMIDGTGDPNTAESYSQAVEMLYAVAYTVKFASKSKLQRDYVVPPLEGLWWSKDMSAFTAREKDKWSWTTMLMVPEWVGTRLIDDAIGRVRENKAPPALDALRVDVLGEGRAVQDLSSLLLSSISPAPAVDVGDLASTQRAREVGEIEAVAASGDVDTAGACRRWLVIVDRVGGPAISGSARP